MKILDTEFSTLNIKFTALCYDLDTIETYWDENKKRYNKQNRHTDTELNCYKFYNMMLQDFFSNILY